MTTQKTTTTPPRTPKAQDTRESLARIAAVFQDKVNAALAAVRVAA